MHISGCNPDSNPSSIRDNGHMPTSPPRAVRIATGRWIGGVSTGLAQHLGWPLPVVRAGFLVLTLANGLGIILYLALWAVMPLRRSPQSSHDTDFARLIAFGAIVVGVSALVVGGLSALGTYVLPIVVLGLGLAILWQQLGPGGRLDLAEDRYRWTRSILGVTLVMAGFITLLVGEIGWLQGLRTLGVLLLIVGGATLLTLPWILRIYRSQAEQKRDLIREQERLEIAVQVHDSVLQTLTLIQASSQDPTRVSRLARTEELRLRTWLYQPEDTAEVSLASAIRATAAQVELDYGAVIDIVSVGECQADSRTDSLIAATTEALVNAAKHAGPQAAISVYSEATSDSIHIYVRDHGPGFDVDAIPGDRHGVRESIVGRLRRSGGRAVVTSSPSGTEIQLELPLEASSAPSGS